MNIHQSVDYSQRQSKHGSVRKITVVPQNGSDVSMLATASANTRFQIPDLVYSLGDSRLEFEVAIPLTATYATFLHHVGQNFIQSIQLRAQSGEVLADLPNAFEFTRATAPYLTSIEDFLERDSNIGAATDIKTDRGANLFRSDALKAAITAVADVSGSNRIYVGAGTNATTVAASKNYTEPCYFSAGTAATARYLKFSIPLSEFSHTMLADKRNIYANSNLQLNIQWNSAQRAGWNAALATPGTQASKIGNTIALSNVRLMLAQETDLKVVTDLQAAVRSGGMKMVMPYVVENVLATPVATNQSTQLRYNSSQGDSLLNIYHAFFHVTNDGYHGADINNNVELGTSDDKVSSFMTSMNSVNLLENRPVCLDAEDYLLMKPLIKGSVVQDSSIYGYNRVWCDSFRQGATKDWKDHDSVIDGLDLSEDRVWAVSATTVSAAYRLFSWAVVQRTLSIMPNGVVTMNPM